MHLTRVSFCVCFSLNHSGTLRVALEFPVNAHTSLVLVVYPAFCFTILQSWIIKPNTASKYSVDSLPRVAINVHKTISKGDSWLLFSSVLRRKEEQEKNPSGWFMSCALVQVATSLHVLCVAYCIRCLSSPESPNCTVISILWGILHYFIFNTFFFFSLVSLILMRIKDFWFNHIHHLWYFSKNTSWGWCGAGAQWTFVRSWPFDPKP